LDPPSPPWGGYRDCVPIPTSDPLGRGDGKETHPTSRYGEVWLARDPTPPLRGGLAGHQEVSRLLVYVDMPHGITGSQTSSKCQPNLLPALGHESKLHTLYAHWSLTDGTTCMTASAGTGIGRCSRSYRAHHALRTCLLPVGRKLLGHWFTLQRIDQDSPLLD